MTTRTTYPYRYISGGDFLDRFTDAELEAFFDLAKTNSAAEVVKERLLRQQMIDVAGARAAKFLTKMVQAGILTAQRAQQIADPGRAVEIEEHLDG